MKTQTTAIQSELARVRGFKRALEAEVEMLRSDTECGKLHIRVSESKDFRQKLAESIVDSASFLRYYYADVVNGVVYKKEDTSPYPWPESASWRIVPIESLFPPNYDFSPEIEDWSSADTWEGCDIGFPDIVRAWLIEEGEELEENGDIPDWTRMYKSNIVSFAFDSELGHYLEAIEAAAKQRAIEFALESVVDEIVIEISKQLRSTASWLSVRKSQIKGRITISK